MLVQAAEYLCSGEEERNGGARRDYRHVGILSGIMYLLYCVPRVRLVSITYFSNRKSQTDRIRWKKKPTIKETGTYMVFHE